MSQTELPPELRRMNEHDERIARDLAEAALDGLASGAFDEEPRLSDAEALAEYDMLADWYTAEKQYSELTSLGQSLKRILERRKATE